MASSLLDLTLALLRESPLPRDDIARGAAVGPEWLKKLLGGHIPDPSVRRIQRLHDYLTSPAAQRAQQVAQAECQQQGG